MTQSTCSVAGCDSPVWIKKRQLCKYCYRRWYNYGDVSWTEPDPITCAGCDLRFTPKHGAQKFCTERCQQGVIDRKRKRTRISCSDCGEPMWDGPGVLPQGQAICRPCRGKRPAANYRAAHVRVKKIKGAADQHTCLHCGGQASSWAYDGDDPNEAYGPGGASKALAYSSDAEHYIPLCQFCHHLFDHYSLDEADLTYQPPAFFNRPIIEWTLSELGQSQEALSKYVRLRRALTIVNREQVH